MKRKSSYLGIVNDDFFPTTYTAVKKESKIIGIVEFGKS